jgi:hypothetical protein
MRDTIDMAREVYGEHTFWTEAQLLRLKAFAELVRADERALAAPVQEPVFTYDQVKAHIQAAMMSAAQPAVPDAFGTREGEHPQYVQGWNDCRAEMLKGSHEPV